LPVLSPFRGLCYDVRLRSDLDRLIAPPYDVISEEGRARLAARHANNIVHLDLPRARPGEDPYRAAAELLREWIGGRILVRDASPAFYACEQRYRAPTGEEATRRGFFARLHLEEFGSGSVVPHEKTFDRPRADRERLLAATRAHLSAVFLLHPDPGAEVTRLMERALASGIFEQARDDEGTSIRVGRLEGAAAESLARRLADAWVLIADGHHRYESALAYRETRRAQGRDDAGFVLAFLCSLEDPGLRIFPIHRLVHSLPGFDAGRLRGLLEKTFSLTRVGDPEALRAALAARRGRPGVFGLALGGEAGFLLAQWREGAGLERPEMATIPEFLRRLDGVLLHRLILEGMLGISAEAQARQTHLDYVKDDREWFARVREEGLDLGVLMNPTRIEQVIDVTRGGYRLPQKSTYFYPKVPSGLVLDPLDP
jgi:uncharacterized protein (DUF1015 family)